jgi:uncharacterized protein
MPVVSNTSPILNLAIIGQLSLLHRQFGNILIPLAVHEELKVEMDLPGSQIIRQALEAGWIQIKEVRDKPFAKVLQHNLDQGEAEAIALALQTGAQWTLLDEREGRRVAKSLGLRVTGVLGILLRAHQEQKLGSLEEVLQELREKAGFHIREELLSDVLKGKS